MATCSLTLCPAAISATSASSIVGNPRHTRGATRSSGRASVPVLVRALDPRLWTFYVAVGRALLPARFGARFGARVGLTGDHGRPRVGSALASSAESVVEARSSAIAEARLDLIDALCLVGGRGREVSEAQKERIDAAVRVLEEDGGVTNPTESPLIEGKWQLMYTTRPSTASPIQRTFVAVDAFTVFQEIQLSATSEPRISNIVSFGESIGQLAVQAEARNEDGSRLAFRFDKAAFDFKALPFKLPYPVPFKLLGDEAKGWLETTYLSHEGNLRISKGNKGTTFILQKNISPRQQLFLSIRRNHDVQKAIDELAPLNPTDAPAASDLLRGKWTQIWSSQSSDALPSQRLSAGFADVFQVIAEDGSTLETVATFLPGVTLKAKAMITPASNARLGVEITGATLVLGPIEIPINMKATGYADQLFLDETLRIVRGSMGSTFVHIKDASIIDTK